MGKIIARILAGEIDLEATGKGGQEWMQRVCREQTVVQTEIERFRTALKKSV
jgi:hypothetical protein